MVNGQQSMVNGQQSIVNSQQSTVFKKNEKLTVKIFVFF